MAKLDPETLVGDHQDGFEFLFDKAQVYADVLPQELHFLEIGCWLGGSACLLMQAIRQSKYPDRLLITVDPYGGKSFRVGPDDVLAADKTNYTDENYRKAICHMSDYARKHSVNHMHFKLTSEDFMATFDQMTLWHNGQKLDHRFGLAYIDGDHHYTSVVAEFEWLKPRLDGLLILDDVPHIRRYDIPVDENVILKLQQTSAWEDNFRLYWESP